MATAWGGKARRAARGAGAAGDRPDDPAAAAAPSPGRVRAATPDERSALGESSPRSSPRRRRTVPMQRSRPSPPTSTASARSRASRRVRAPRGERPVAVGHRRLEWLHVTAFVVTALIPPATGESFRHLSTGVVPGATSRTSPCFSPARQGRDPAGSSCSCSTTPDGTAPPASARARWPVPDGPCPMACARWPAPRPPATPGSSPGQALHARAPAGRDAVGPPRRADRQPARRDPQRARCRRRQAMRRPACRPQPRQRPGRLPSVAQPRRLEPISRKTCDG